MCRPTTCKTCRKTTWAGCGQHAAQVKAAVPTEQWCSGQHTAEERTAATTSRGGLFGRLFSR